MFLGLAVSVVLSVGSGGFAPLASTVPHDTNPGIASGPIVLLPYLATGYRYSIVGFGQGAGFEQTGFDDSGFSVGDAGFGTPSGGCPLNSPDYVKTEWPLQTDILVRKMFDVPRGITEVRVGVAIDNDVQVFINGHDVSGGLQIHEFCSTRDSFVFSVPDQILIVGANLLAVRGRDRGGLSYLDVQVTAVQSNQAPTANAGGPYAVSEGSAVTFDGSGSTDPEGNALSYRWDFNGDGTWDSSSSPNPTATHPFGDDWVGQAFVEVSDGELMDVASVSVTVTNVAPMIALALIPSGHEAQSLTFEARVTDPGSDDLVVSWSGACSGWSGPTMYANDPNAFPDPDPSPEMNSRDVTDLQIVTCGDDGTFDWNLRAEDDDGGMATALGAFSVSNVSPGMTVPPPTFVATDEGVAWTLTATAEDAGSDDLTFTWMWELGPKEIHRHYNDGSRADDDPSPGGVFPFAATDASTHTYGDDGTYAVALLVEDDDGGSVTVVTTLSIANLPPALTVSPPDAMVVDEGTLVSVAASAEDPGSDDLTFTWMWLHGPSEKRTFYNGGVGPDPEVSPGGAFPFTASDASSRTYGDDCVCQLSLAIEDDDGGVTKFDTPLGVANVAPIVSASDMAGDEAAPISFAAAFSDPGFDSGAGDSREDFTATIGWGDGSMESVEVTEVPGGPGVPTTGSLAADHAYGDDGVFAVLVTVCDDDGGCGVASALITVVNVAPTASLEALAQAHEHGLPADRLYPFEPITFNGSAIDVGSDDLSFAYDFGDGTSRAGGVYFNNGLGPDPDPSPGGTHPFPANDVVEHTYRLPGDYVVTLTATDDDGGVATAARTIHVTSAMDLKNESIARIRALKQQAMDRQDGKFLRNLDDAERFVLMSLGHADPYRPDSITATLSADVSVSRNEGDRIDLRLGPSWTAKLPSYNAVHVTWANGVVTTVALPDDWPEEDLEAHERVWVDLRMQDLAVDSKEKKNAVTFKLRVHDASMPFSLSLDADRVSDLSFAYDVRPWWTDGAHLSPEFGASVFLCERAAVDRLVRLEFPDDDDEDEDADGVGGSPCHDEDDDDEDEDEDEDDRDSEEDDGTPGFGILDGDDDDDDDDEDDEDDGSGNVTVRCRLTPKLWSDAERAALDAECDAIANLLVKADEMLARIALADARDTPVNDPANQARVDREIAKAEASLAKGLEGWTAHGYGDTICAILDAWTHAQRAMKFAMR